MHFATLLFDLDDTLYPSTAGLWHAIRKRMSDYMYEILKLPLEKIPEMRQYYLETYGTTLRGLQHDYKIDADDYLAYVHDLPLDEYIDPDPELRDILLSLPQQRWIFTNADAAHAKRVLAVIGLQDCFQGIIDVRTMNFICKPDQEAYLYALNITQEVNPAKCVIFDDSIRNLNPANELGFFTVLVGKIENQHQADRMILSLHDLHDTIPELWDK
jgi:pyrimidine 5'-nucleotidase